VAAAPAGPTASGAPQVRLQRPPGVMPDAKMRALLKAELKLIRAAASRPAPAEAKKVRSHAQLVGVSPKVVARPPPPNVRGLFGVSSVCQVRLSTELMRRIGGE
jgi:hypothetical protein